MPENQHERDCAYMKLALREARKGIGLVSPNPPVGCVIVKGTRFLVKGHHREAGGPHAEIEAMAKATPRQLKGATAYITLEPCSTQGKTGPCAEALAEAGISRVVYGATDPNPNHSGRAKRLLKKRGIEVTDGVLREDCETFIRPWAKFITTGMPWVIAKAGCSLDGRLTRPKGESQWLTSPESRADAGKLRGEVDAILIGAGTLRADDPALTLRDPAALKRGVRQPLRVVLTKRGHLPQGAALFTDKHRNRTLVYRGKTLRAVLKDLAKKHACVGVMIEGGGDLLGDAFKRGLVDETCLYLAPILCGDKTAPFIAAALPGSAEIVDPQVRRVGPDVKLRGLIR